MRDTGEGRKWINLQLKGKFMNTHGIGINDVW